MDSTIQVTVKTLDSQNHEFAVSEEMMVKDFKTLISEKIIIPSDQQRLIFRGRVLQDEKKIGEYNVGNNTIHVVQRPGTTNSRSNDEPPRNPERGTEGGGMLIGGDGRNALIMGTIGMPSIDIQAQTGPIQNPGGRSGASVRLQVSNQMLGRASTLLSRLEADETILLAGAGDNSSVTENAATASDSVSSSDDALQNAGDNNRMDIDVDDPNSLGRIISQVANATSAAAIMAAIRQGGQAPPNQAGGQSNNNSNVQMGLNGRPSTGQPGQPGSIPVVGAVTTDPRRPEPPRLREMAVVIQDILALQERLLPYLQFVENTMRSNRQYDNVEEQQSTQFLFDTITAILHYLSHSYHALSDIVCDFSTPANTRRLRAATAILVEQSTVVRATIPIAVPAGFGGGGMENNAQPTTNPPPAANTNITGSNDTPIPNATTQQQQPQPQIPSFSFGPTGQLNLGSLGQGNFGQIHVNIAGPGIPQQNAGFFGGMDAGAGQAMGGGMGQGFNIQDLAAMLGPLAGGMMLNPNQPNQTQQQSNPNSTNATPTPNPNSINVTSTPNSNTNTNTTSSANTILAGNNTSGITGAHIQRSPFDMLLSCNSHHGPRIQQSSRPTNFRHYVDVRVAPANRTSSEDFLPTCVDVLLQSNLLTLVQPIFQDLIINYLMRGRDAKNKDHVRSCAKSMAKKISPFFESFLVQVPGRSKNVAYSTTFCNLITTVLTELIYLTATASSVGYRSLVISACDNFVRDLIAVFKVCFNGCDGYLKLFVEFLMNKLFSGNSLLFRENASRALAEYFSAHAAVTIDAAPLIVYNEAKEDATSSSRQQASGSVPIVIPAPTTPITRPPGPGASPEVLPPKQAKPSTPTVTSVPTPVQHMDEDIDDLLNLPAPDRPSPRVQNTLPLAGRFDAALRNTPSEWVDTVRHDVTRQLGMPEQPPFSPGYVALLSRKP